MRVMSWMPYRRIPAGGRHRHEEDESDQGGQITRIRGPVRRKVMVVLVEVLCIAANAFKIASSAAGRRQGIDALGHARVRVKCWSLAWKLKTPWRSRIRVRVHVLL